MILKVFKSKPFAIGFFLFIWTLTVLSLKNNYEILVYPIISIGILYEVLTSKQKYKVTILLILLGLMGWTLQSLEAYLGTLIIFGSEPLAPPWLALLWALFMSSTLRTMSFAFKNIYTSFLFGCYALPGTYFFISKLGLATIKAPIWQSLLLDALLSGFIFAITYLLLHHFFQKKGQLYV
jgi:hypothetical protein